MLRSPHTNPSTSLQLYRTSPPVPPQVVIQYRLFVRLLLYCKVCLVLQRIAMIHKLLCNFTTMINLSVTKFNFFPQLSFSVVQMQPLEPFHVLQSEDPQVAPNM